MRFFIGEKEKDFFREKGFFTYEEVFSPEEIDSLRLAVEQREKAGVVRNLAWEEGKVREVLFSKRLAHIAYELGGKLPLRYGYDIFFRPYRAPKSLAASITPLRIGACIALESVDTPASPVFEGTSPLRAEDLPRTKGSVLFFSPEKKLEIESSSSQGFILLLYAGDRAQYIFQPDDKTTHELKRFGYVFGDVLRADTHPFLYM